MKKNRRVEKEKSRNILIASLFTKVKFNRNTMEIYKI